MLAATSAAIIDSADKSNLHKILRRFFGDSSCGGDVRCLSCEPSHATVLSMTVSTLIDQQLLGRRDSNGSVSMSAISTLRVDVYKDQLGMTFGTYEHLGDYRLRPLDAVVPDVYWKDHVAVNDLIGEITSDREDTLIKKVADRIATHHGLPSINVSFIGNSQYCFRYNESDYVVSVGVDHLTGGLHAVALIEDTDVENINNNILSQEALWTPCYAPSGDETRSTDAHLDSQYIVFVGDSELYFRINVFRSRSDNKLFATGETQDAYELYEPYIDSPIRSQLWVPTPAEYLTRDLRSDSTDGLIETFKKRIERQSLLPISQVLVREDQFIICDLSDPNCKNYDLRINVYRDVTNDMRSVSVEEKRTVILSPEDYNDDDPEPIISDLWIPLDSMPYTIEDIDSVVDKDNVISVVLRKIGSHKEIRPTD